MTRWAVIGVLALAGVSAPAAAQFDEPEAAPELVPEDAMVAYLLAEGWTRAGSVPEADDLPSSPRTGLFGVNVVLRTDGKVIGRGVALRSDLIAAIDNPRAPATSLSVLLASALGDALLEVDQYQRRRAREVGQSDPVLMERALAALLATLQVDVQLGYNLESVVLAADSPRDAVFAQFVPGFHGLRLSGSLMPDADMLWPATALMRNTPPRSQLVQLLVRQGYDESNLPLVARPQGTSLERFSIYQVVQSEPGGRAIPMVRGNPVSPDLPDSQQIEAIARRIAQHLDNKIERRDGQDFRRMQGSYQPSFNRYQPEHANARQAALASYALMLAYAEDQRQNPGNAVSRLAAVHTADVVNGLAAGVADEPHQNVVTASLVLMAMVHSPAAINEEHRDQIGEALLALRHPEGGYRIAPGEDRRATRSDASVMTAALATWYRLKRDANLATEVWAAIGELIEVNRDDHESGVGASITDMTWVSIAFARLGRRVAGALDDPKAQEQLAAIDAFLVEQLGWIDAQQVRGRPLFGPDDIAGGFVLQEGPPGSAPDPNWESSMPLTMIALSLRDPGLVPADNSFGQRVSAGWGARFIGQLMMTRQNAYYVKDPDAAFGGIRHSLWDNSLHLDCASMSLIAITELRTSLHQLERRSRD